MYVDRRCYKCFIMPRGYPSEDDDFAQYVYEGKGIFKCSRCGHIMNLSNSTYDVRLNVTKSGEPDDEWLEIDIVEPYDPKILVIPQDGKITVKQQMDEDLNEYQEEFWDGSYGLFDVELYFHWSSSGYYVVEWDLDIEIFKKTVVEVQSSKLEETKK